MRTILYVDPPAFCTSVEGLVAPALRSRPVAVAPPGADRAVILALSPEARAAGLVRGMAIRLARRICPDLILLPPNPQLYARASRALHDLLARWAPIIEPRGYGHAFLDLSGTERLFGPPHDVAARLRQEARQRLRLTLSVGLARNKVVSEAATRTYRQHTPLPTDYPPLAVQRGTEARFLAPYPLAVLPNIPDLIRRRLDDYQLDRIGDVAGLREADLIAVFGLLGRTLWARAQGIDPRPVLPPHIRHTFRLSHTLATDTNDLTILHPLLRRLTDQLGRRLRQRGLAARRITVLLEFTDYAKAHRSLPLPVATLDTDLWSTARRALGTALTRRTAVRVVTVRVDHLVTAGVQLDLWETSPPPDEAVSPGSPHSLQAAVDRITTRWGARAAQHGTTVPSHRSE